LKKAKGGTVKAKGNEGLRCSGTYRQKQKTWMFRLEDSSVREKERNDV
jgi:hypothetical protein